MWRCTQCYSPDVEKLDWVDLNSKENLDDDLDEFYCRSCGTQVDVYYDIDDDTDDLIENEETT